MVKGGRSGRRRMKNVGKPFVMVLAIVGIAQGQQDADADIQCNATSQWMNNAVDESPCRVARNLILQCAPSTDTVTIPPLNNNTKFYNNTYVWGNGTCSCNTVVYNLISGCEICQGFKPMDFSYWISPCPQDSIKYMDYPSAEVAQTFNTPTWAYVNTTSSGRFDKDEAIEVAGGKTREHWDTIQILAPVISAVGVLLIALGIFIWYRRHVKKRYVRIGDQSFFGNARAHASSSTATLRSWVAGASTDRSTSTRRTKYKGKSVAWQSANLQAPRKLGGLIPNRPRVHHRTRGADWSIDTEDTEFDDLDPLQPGSSSSNLNGNDSTPSFASSQGRRNRTQGPSHNGNTEGLRPIQDAPDVVGLTNVRPMQGVDRRGRPPPVHVVSTPPQRGFHLDDVDSAGTPTPIATRPPAGATSARGGGRGVESSDRGREEVLLISRRPGEDFTSTVLASPVDTEGLQSFSTSRQDSGGQWPPAFSDDSPILRPSFSRDRSGLNAFTTNPTIRHSPPPDGTFPPSSFHLIRPKASDPQLLVPASVRAAGYSPKLGVALALPETTHFRTISEPNLPAGRDVDEPVRAYRKPANQIRHSTTLSDVASSRSSDYNVPNPWRLDPRKPYSAAHLSPPLPPATHAFKSSVPVDFDLDA